MSDQPPPPPESDADVVLFALKNMGSANYANLAIATGLSKPAISSAVTELTKRGLVTGKSGTYSPTEAATSEPATTAKPAKAAKSDTPPPPPPPPPAAKKAQPAKKATDSKDDTDAVLTALKNMGSGTYATLATATGLSKPAVSAAITELTKRGQVTGKSGEYSLTGTTADKKQAATEPAKAAAKPKPAAAAKKPEPATKPAAADSGDDAEVVLAALKNMGSGTYATLATATGLSKPAVSAAITELGKRGLVSGKSGEYSLTDGTAAKPAAKPKAAPAAKTPKAAAAPTATSSASLAEELERLTALRDAGALTAAEFTKAKKKLLDTT